MKGTISFISTKNWSSEEWYAYRQTGIGASEAYIALGNSSPFTAPIRLFHEKTNLWPAYHEDSHHTWAGKSAENMIAENYWAYYTSEDEFIVNINNPDFKPRRYRQVNGFLRNSKYPHLFASLDRMALSNQRRVLDGLIEPKEFPIEIKNVPNASNIKKYIGNLYPSMLTQTQCQMLVSGKNYMELSMLFDGHTPLVYGFEREQSYLDILVEVTSVFWDNVQKTKDLLKKRVQYEMSGDTVGAEQITWEMQKLEPALVGGEGESDFLKEKFKNRPKGIMAEGSSEQFKYLETMLEIQKEIDPLEEELSRLKNNITAFMGEKGIDKLIFPGHGYVSWAKNINEVRTFRNNIK